MASPQGDKNYTKISNEIIEALATTDLSNYEFRVFIIILRKIYGFHKKKDWIALTQISKITGIQLTHISRTIKKLINKNMIKKIGKIIEIQKDYELWNIPKQVLNQDEKVTQTGNKKLPKQVTNKIKVMHEKLPKQVMEVTQTGNKKLPKQVTTKDNTKETITKDKVHVPCDEIINLYLVNCISLPKIKELTPDRKKVIKLRWLKYQDLYTFEDLFKRAEKSDFLSGRNGKWTSCNLDWLINEKNMLKVLEGNYENKGGNTNGNGKHFSNEREYEDSEQSAARKRFYRE